MTYKVNDLVYFEEDWKKGVGKIVAISGNSFLVHSTQITGGHDGNEIVEEQDNKNNWFFIEEHLKPFIKKVGQKYKVLRDGHYNFREGDIATLTNLYEDGTSIYKTDDEEWFLHDIDHRRCEVEFYADAEEHKGNEMFTKDDLKVGYLVKLRCGELAHVVNTTKGGACLNYEDGYSKIGNYNNNLTNKSFYHLDITEVYGYTLYGHHAHKFEVEDRELLWKREETKEMTIEDIQKALGHKIKVVE